MTKDQQDELSDLRRWAIILFLGLSALIVIVDNFGRLLFRPDFHADPVLSGLVFGGLVSMLGLEGINKAAAKVKSG